MKNFSLLFIFLFSLHTLTASQYVNVSELPSLTRSVDDVLDRKSNFSNSYGCTMTTWEHKEGIFGVGFLGDASISFVKITPNETIQLYETNKTTTQTLLLLAIKNQTTLLNAAHQELVKAASKNNITVQSDFKLLLHEMRKIAHSEGSSIHKFLPLLESK